MGERVFGRSGGYGKVATNPCRRGYHGEPAHECSCSQSMVSRDQKRIPSTRSGRAQSRLGAGPKVSRMIADLEGTTDIQTQHLAEAIQYRPRRQVWRGSGESTPLGLLPYVCRHRP